MTERSDPIDEATADRLLSSDPDMLDELQHPEVTACVNEIRSWVRNLPTPVRT